MPDLVVGILKANNEADRCFVELEPDKGARQVNDNHFN
jgi:hypothetical protein